METAFEIILKNSENVLSKVYGDLDSHRLIYRDECIFDGELHNTGLAEFPMNIELFPNMHRYEQEEWLGMIADMYTAYADCMPRRSRHLNFISGQAYVNKGYPDFHHRRIILDMFILFGYHAELFSWNNPAYFMLRACDNCVVYRRWVV